MKLALKAYVETKDRIEFYTYKGLFVSEILLQHFAMIEEMIISIFY